MCWEQQVRAELLKTRLHDRLFLACAGLGDLFIAVRNHLCMRAASSRLWSAALLTLLCQPVRINAANAARNSVSKLQPCPSTRLQPSMSAGQGRCTWRPVSRT